MKKTLTLIMFLFMCVSCKNPIETTKDQKNGIIEIKGLETIYLDKIEDFTQPLDLKKFSSISKDGYSKDGYTYSSTKYFEKYVTKDNYYYYTKEGTSKTFLYEYNGQDVKEIYSSNNTFSKLEYHLRFEYENNIYYYLEVPRMENERARFILFNYTTKEESLVTTEENYEKYEPFFKDGILYFAESSGSNGISNAVYKYDIKTKETIRIDFGIGPMVLKDDQLIYVKKTFITKNDMGTTEDTLIFYDLKSQKKDIKDLGIINIRNLEISDGVIYLITNLKKDYSNFSFDKPDQYYFNRFDEVNNKLELIANIETFDSYNLVLRTFEDSALIQLYYQEHLGNYGNILFRSQLYNPKTNQLYVTQGETKALALGVKGKIEKTDYTQLSLIGNGAIFSSYDSASNSFKDSYMSVDEIIEYANSKGKKKDPWHK